MARRDRQHDEGTEYTLRMLYWGCNANSYYAGEIGSQSRYPTRTPRSQRQTV